MLQRRRYIGLIQWIIIAAVVYMCFYPYMNIRRKIYPKLRFNPPPLKAYQCSMAINSKPENISIHKDTLFKSTVKSKRILLVSERSTWKQTSILNFLRTLKLQVRIETPDDSVPLLELFGKRRFSLIIFENYNTFLELPEIHRNAYLEYCKSFGVGIISFVQEPLIYSDLDFTPLYEQYALKLKFSETSKISFTGKSIKQNAAKVGNDLICVNLTHDTEGTEIVLEAETVYGEKMGAIIHDTGKFIGMESVLFGHSLDHWMIKIAFLDTIQYLLKEDKLAIGKDRYIQIDIDDVFVGQSGSRFVPDDLREYVQDFHYTLGFSGYFFRHGDELENTGDEQLMAFSDMFLWFPHMWRHNHAHEFSTSYLLALMTQNKIFAENTKLNTSLNYAISPQHSGVYPIHEALYDGIEQLQTSIFGGDLFTTILLNRISIFMTHQQNFANDRLGIYTFENLVNFLQCWTTLRLKWVKPLKLANMYFEQFPSEKTLLYTNPCADSRHRRMRTRGLRDLIRPQKTGTSALLNFLLLHPNVTSNIHIEKSFEELQFFGGPNYGEGIEWYSEKFAHVTSNDLIIFEKTANYFDNEQAPLAIHTLIPNAKIIVVAIDPVVRAYSWYQHMRAHNDSVALKYDFIEIFSSNKSEVNRLKQRCIYPGLYAKHLDRWLDYFLPSQIILVDGQKLRENPIEVMNDLASKFELSKVLNFSEKLKFEPKKGFYCTISSSGGSKCLGSGKGRAYPPLENHLKNDLDKQFEKANIALLNLLKRYKFPIPTWLSRLQI